MKNLFRIALLLGLAQSAIAGSFTSRDKGTTTANFLKLGAGSRAAAMGEAFSAVADDASALYWNPAGLTRIPAKSISASFMHATYIESSFYDYGSFAKNIAGSDTWGGSLQYFSAGKITETNDSGFEQGTFNPYDLAVALGYAHKFTHFSWGMSGKFIRSQILDSAQTGAIDMGVLSRPLWHDRLYLAGTLTNLGGKMKFEQDSFALPMAFRLGSSYKFSNQWTTALDLALPSDNDPYWALGTEYLWPLGRTTTLAARAGINTRTLRDVEGFSGASFGLGLSFDFLSVDYSFLPMGSLGFTHRITLSFKFEPQFITLPKRASVLHGPQYEELPGDFDETPSLKELMQ
jgi:hypothetical protein